MPTMTDDKQRVWDILSTPFDVSQSKMRYQTFMGNADQYLSVPGIPSMIVLNGIHLKPGIDYIIHIGPMSSSIAFTRPMIMGDIVTIY